MDNAPSSFSGIARKKLIFFLWGVPLLIYISMIRSDHLRKNFWFERLDKRERALWVVLPELQMEKEGVQNKSLWCQISHGGKFLSSLIYIIHTYIHQEPTLTSSLPHTLNPGPTRTADPWTTESVSLALRPSWQSHRTCMAVIPIMTFPIRWATVNGYYASRPEIFKTFLACLDVVDTGQWLTRTRSPHSAGPALTIPCAGFPSNWGDQVPSSLYPTQNYIDLASKDGRIAQMYKDDGPPLEIEINMAHHYLRSVTLKIR